MSRDDLPEGAPEDDGIPPELNLHPLQRELWKKLGGKKEDLVWPGGSAPGMKTDGALLKSLLDSSRKVIGVDPGHPDQESLTSYQFVDEQGRHWLICKPGSHIPGFEPDPEPDYTVIEEISEFTPEQWEKIKAWARRDEPQSHSFKVGDGKTEIHEKDASWGYIKDMRYRESPNEERLRKIAEQDATIIDLRAANQIPSQPLPSNEKIHFGSIGSGGNVLDATLKDFMNDFNVGMETVSEQIIDFVNDIGKVNLNLEDLAKQISHIAAGIEEGTKEEAQKRSRDDLKKKRQQMRRRKGKL